VSTAPDAQSPKFTNSAQGLVPDINIKERLMRSRSFVPCYNKSNSDAQSPKLINCGTVVAHGMTANTYTKYCGTVVHQVLRHCRRTRHDGQHVHHPLRHHRSDQIEIDPIHTSSSSMVALLRGGTLCPWHSMCRCCLRSIPTPLTGRGRRRLHGTTCRSSGQCRRCLRSGRRRCCL